MFKNFFFTFVSAIIFAIILISSCSKDQSNEAKENLTLHTSQREEVSESFSYFVDSLPVTKASYDAEAEDTTNFKHFVRFNTDQDVIQNDCHVFTTRSLYEKWGDDRGYEVTKYLKFGDEMSQIADSANLSGLYSLPNWFKEAENEMIEKYFGSAPTPDVLCYFTYFWDFTTQQNLPDHIKAGFMAVADGVIGINNNTFSSWKGDVSPDCTGHKKAQLVAYDRWFFRKHIGTITTEGDVFVPFTNIYANFNNKISSYVSGGLK